MLTEEITMLAKGTALNTGGADNYVIGNVIDLDVARDIGNLTELYFVVQVVTATDSANDTATLQIKLVSDSTDTIDPDTYTVHHVTGTFVSSDMPAGTRLCAVKIPLEGSQPYERYLGLVQVTGVQAFSAGAIDAFFTPTVQANKHYPEYDGV
jgi:hypothetical protein